MARKNKVLVIGPSTTASKGGMASVILQEKKSEFLNEHLDMKFFSSYIDGGLLKRFFYCFFKIVCGMFYIPAADTVHIHMTSKGSMVRKMFYLWEAFLFHKKTVIQIHCCDYFLNCLYKMPLWYQRIVQRSLLKADHILCLSEKFKERLEKELYLTNCDYFPNGIDPSEYNYNEKGELLLFLGKITEDKGVPDLLKALSILEDKKYYVPCVIGGCGKIEEMKELADKYRLKEISFPGWIDMERKKEELAKSKVLVLPSYHEGFPVVLLEAMASGTDIVATCVGAVPEITETELLPGEPEHLAEQIQKAFDRYDKTKIRENKKTVDEKYNINVLHQKLLRYLE